MPFSQVLLCIAAAVSLALGLYFDFGVKATPVVFPSTGLLECFEPEVDWVEGVAILIAVIIIAMVGLLKGTSVLGAQRQKRGSNHQGHSGRSRIGYQRQGSIFRVELSMKKTDSATNRMWS